MAHLRVSDVSILKRLFLFSPWGALTHSVVNCKSLVLLYPPSHSQYPTLPYTCHNILTNTFISSILRHAGALAACALCCDYPATKIGEEIVEAKRVGQENFLNMVPLVHEATERLCPHDAHLKCRYVCVGGVIGH